MPIHMWRERNDASHLADSGSFRQLHFFIRRVLDVNVGPDDANGFVRAHLVKGEDIIDAGEGRDQLGTICLRHERALRTFVELANRVVGIDAHDQYRTEAASKFQIADVPHMKQVKDAAREDDFSADCTDRPKPSRDVRARKHFIRGAHVVSFAAILDVRKR